MQPASLAKIMTFYITLDSLKDGRIKLDTSMPISEKAWRLSMDDTVSRMFLEVGEQVQVKDLLYGVMVSSGIDAAEVLAEYLGGTPEAFAQMMNSQAEKLGLRETRFANPDGLPEPNQYTTAYDMVKLARALIKNHPEGFDYTSVKEYTFHNIQQRNWNTLLFYDSRVNGLKTGHVAESGFHLVATAKSGDVELVSAVMGAPNAEKRRVETEKLLDWAFRTYVTIPLDWHRAIPHEVVVCEGAADTVAIAPQELNSITVEKGQESKVTVSGRIERPVLVAPVSAGTRVGEVQVSQNGRPVMIVTVKTRDAVARGGFFKVTGDRFRLFVHRVMHGIGSALHSLLRLIPFYKG